MSYSPNLVIKLNTIAHQYRDLIDRSLHQVLSDPKYRNTGASLAEVNVSVVDGDESKAPQVIVHLPDSLVILDKRKVQWTKLPPVKELLAWAQTKESNPVRAKKLAWAVAWDKKKHDTWKAKPWRKKSLSAVLKDMNKQVLISFDQAIEEDLQTTIDKAMK